jgi:UDP-N-acetylglucosamine transferase subunit ALG13
MASPGEDRRAGALGGRGLIFITVGTQLPFDRLLRAVDGWAGAHPGVECHGQIGPAGYRPTAFKTVDFLPPDQADDLFKRAQLIVSHAGMGSVLTALRFRKPIIIFPRVAALGEHRNEHQLATAAWLECKPGVFVARTEEALLTLLDQRNALPAGEQISDSADPAFIARLRSAID